MISVVIRFLLCFTLLAAIVSANDKNKYFHEPAEDDLRRHYDSRFFKNIVSDEERQITLTALVRAYLLLFEKLDLETWIAHGTLLGWFWNGKILPWDWDLDTQVTNATLHELGQKHNRTYHEYHSAQLNVTRRYLLDVNSWSWERVRGDGANIIDARFIDVSNGLFLDITGLSANDPQKPDVIECKNEHKYNSSEIFPLRYSVFEGVPAKVPYAYTQILADEYSVESLIQTEFHNHTFDARQGNWQKVISSPDAAQNEVAPTDGAYS